MKISNSALSTFWSCPTEFQEQYINGIQLKKTYLDFGQRFHEYLQHHYCGGELNASTLSTEDEATCESMFEAYKAAYPVEDFGIVDCEKVFELKLGQDHIYTGRFDMLVRRKENGKLALFETKTESRSSKRNMPEAWLARTQGSLYTWAARRVYGEQIDTIILNVATKGSDKGRIGPTFRRDILHRTEAQIEDAVKTLKWTADAIEQMQSNNYFPKNTNSCVSEFGWKCDYYSLCHLGRDAATLSPFVQIEPFSYLSI